MDFSSFNLKCCVAYKRKKCIESVGTSKFQLQLCFVSSQVYELNFPIVSELGRQNGGEMHFWVDPVGVMKLASKVNRSNTSIVCVLSPYTRV